MWVRIGLKEMLAFSPRVTAIYTMNTGGISETHAHRRRTASAAWFEMPDNPIYALLDNTLRDPAFNPLHGLIKTYLDAGALTVAHNAIFDGR